MKIKLLYIVVSILYINSAYAYKWGKIGAALSAMAAAVYTLSSSGTPSEEVCSLDGTGEATTFVYEEGFFGDELTEGKVEVTYLPFEELTEKYPEDEFEGNQKSIFSLKESNFEKEMSVIKSLLTSDEKRDPKQFRKDYSKAVLKLLAQVEEKYSTKKNPVVCYNFRPRSGADTFLQPHIDHEDNPKTDINHLENIQEHLSPEMLEKWDKNDDIWKNKLSDFVT